VINVEKSRVTVSRSTSYNSSSLSTAAAALGVVVKTFQNVVPAESRLKYRSDARSSITVSSPRWLINERFRAHRRLPDVANRDLDDAGDAQR
jgi:hypothetical protein